MSESEWNLILLGGAALFVIVAIVVRIAVNTQSHRAAENRQMAATLGADGMSILAENDPHMQKLILQLQTTVVFDAPIERVERVLAEVRPPFGWTRDGGRRWEYRSSVLKDAVVLVEHETSARLMVALSAGRDGMPFGATDWQGFKKRVLKSAATAKIPTREVVDAELVRDGTTWLRPGRDPKSA